MTRNQRKWMDKTGYSEQDYVAHLEDALMMACSQLYRYDLSGIPYKTFLYLLEKSKINSQTRESSFFRSEEI